LPYYDRNHYLLDYDHYGIHHECDFNDACHQGPVLEYLLVRVDHDPVDLRDKASVEDAIEQGINWCQCEVSDVH
jgi:hypothetical protein